MNPAFLTLGDLIFEAYVMAGMADPRDGVLAPEDSNYGYRKCNDLIDYLAAERLAIYRSERVGPFAVTAGMGDVNVAPITIGPGATWDTPRPVWIDRAGVIYTAGGTPQPELAVHVFTTQEWARVGVKSITATLSRSLFYDRLFNSSGYGNIYLYPVPSASFSMVLYVPEALAQMPDDGAGNPVFTTLVSTPSGYRAMLVANLARIISIGVVEIGADLKEEAVSTLARVKASNVVTHMDALSCDAAVVNRDGRTSGWDWLTGNLD